MYLLDSDYLIDILKGKNNVKITVEKIQKEKLFTSVICVAEVLEGLIIEHDEEKFLGALNIFQIIDVNYSIVEIFAKIRRDLRKKGKLIDNFDLLIASTCLVHNLTLITGNISHFKRIPKLKIYKER